jgi:hypothetical protein
MMCTSRKSITYPNRNRSHALPSAPPRISANATVVAVNLTAKLQQRHQHRNRRQQRKKQQHPPHPGRRTRIVKQTKRRAGVFHMTDREHMGNHDHVLPSSIRVDANHFVTRSATTTNHRKQQKPSPRILIHALMRLLAGEHPSDRAPPSSARTPSASANPHPHARNSSSTARTSYHRPATWSR